MKNIGILTLGLKHNYGGILQATALYNFLNNEGYVPLLIRKYPIQNSFKFLILRVLEIIPFQNLKGLRNAHIKYKNNINFLNYYMPNQTKVFKYKTEIEEYLKENSIDYLIVGSDQVWRYSYINDSEYDTYFLNFNIAKKIKKISYAASFGIDRWEEPSKNLDVKKYLSDFNAISVRETSGKLICKENFEIENVQIVLDPTFLVNKSFYLDMIKDSRKTFYDCITYILDKSDRKLKLIDNFNLKYKHINKFDLLSRSSKLTINDWVSYYYYTDFIITDSFHGMVFSIIFNKEFVVLINDDRGRDRFESLCNILGLEDRLISLDQDIIPDFKKINYTEINEKLRLLKIKSKKFLLDTLE